MNSRKHKRILKECLSLLSSNGIDLNDQLTRVFEYFFSTDHHVSHDDIQKYIDDSNLKIDNSVIPEALRLLVDYGFAVEKSFGDNEIRYEHLHLGEHHDHFYCLKCGAIIEFFSEDLENIQSTQAQSHRFHAFTHKLQIHGLCSECFAKSSRCHIPLSEVPAGGKFRVIDIKSCHKSVVTKRRIMELGIMPGMPGEVITNSTGRQVIASQGCRTALSSVISKQIIVAIEN